MDKGAGERWWYLYRSGEWKEIIIVGKLCRSVPR